MSWRSQKIVNMAKQKKSFDVTESGSDSDHSTLNVSERLSSSFENLPEVPHEHRDIIESIEIYSPPASCKTDTVDEIKEHLKQNINCSVRLDPQNYKDPALASSTPKFDTIDDFKNRLNKYNCSVELDPQEDQQPALASSTPETDTVDVNKENCSVELNSQDPQSALDIDITSINDFIYISNDGNLTNKQSINKISILQNILINPKTEQNSFSTDVPINKPGSSSAVLSSDIISTNYCLNSSNFPKHKIADPTTKQYTIIEVLDVTDLTANIETNTENLTIVKPRIVRYPDYCYYCNNEVKNFARHILRNHSQEFEVQKISILPPKSLERKRLIASLRKQGNFLKNSESLYKPVHKSYVDTSEINYIPCPFCFGLYSRKLLWRHKKKCSKNNNPSILTSLGDSQNALIPRLKINADLRVKVFPRMRADYVSLVAKKDTLITSFGARYLNIHREQHHINVCSRKMRELAKILIESQKIDPGIRNLYDLLHPKYFDIVVSATKIIAKYDSDNDVYLSPTFGMNISRSLKDCCDIAILHIVKQKYNSFNVSAAEIESNILMFKKLLESTWKYEVSSHAGNDLNTKTWNKITIIPLAADLKLFKDYLIKTGNAAESKLKEDMFDTKNFQLLMETVFCRLLLLNRKRIGELQRMKLITYVQVDKKPTQSYEEFSEAVTASEQILLKNFKRVVIRGKRGRGVPVLFSKDMQDHMHFLLSVRPNIVQQNNLFLFCNINSDKPITGYKVLQKHAKLCGAKNPTALTSTKLRKHLATLTQLFNMTPNDIEQLATFMGHTIDVHNKVYRLPDDIFQTAKIAKLLMLMESGDAGKYKGKTLDEINVDMDEEIDLNENDQENNDFCDNEDIENPMLESNEPKEDEGNDINTTKTTCSTKKRELVPWTDQQKKVVIDYFRSHIKNKKPPKRGECDLLLEENPDLLKNKSWTKIKVFIQNLYTKKIKFTPDN